MSLAAMQDALTYMPSPRQTIIIRISDTNSNNHTQEQCHGLYTDVKVMEYCMAELADYRGNDKQELDNYKL